MIFFFFFLNFFLENTRVLKLPRALKFVSVYSLKINFCKGIHTCISNITKIALILNAERRRKKRAAQHELEWISNVISRRARFDLLIIEITNKVYKVN